MENDFIQDFVAGQTYYNPQRMRQELPWWAGLAELVMPGDQFSGALETGENEFKRRRLQNALESNPRYAVIKPQIMDIAETQGPDAAMAQLEPIAQRVEDKRTENQLRSRSEILNKPELDKLTAQIGLQRDLSKNDLTMQLNALNAQSRAAENTLANQLALANINADTAKYGVDARNKMALERDANDKRMMMIVLGLQGLDGLLSRFS